jgi:hypothetical protein
MDYRIHTYYFTFLTVLLKLNDQPGKIKHTDLNVLFCEIHYLTEEKKSSRQQLNIAYYYTPYIYTRSPPLQSAMRTSATLPAMQTTITLGYADCHPNPP